MSDSVENIQVKISSEIDSTALQELRQRLNESRNELNAVARETDKADKNYKVLKESVRELNRIIKLSDADLRQYASSLIQTETAVTRVNTSKTRLITTADKFSRSITNIKTNVGQYSTTLVNLSGDIASGDKTMMESVGTLGLYAGGWAAIASAIFLATSNLVDFLNTNTDEIKNHVPNINNQGGSDVLPGGDGSLSKYNKKRTGMFFDDPSGFFQEEKHYAKEILAEEGRITKERKQSLGHTKATKDELDEIQRLQKELVSLEADKVSFIAQYGDQAGIVLNTLNKIKDVQEKLTLLTGTRKIYDTSGVVLPERKIPLFSSEDIKQMQYQAQSDSIMEISKQDSRDTLQDIQQGYSLLSQAMSVLNIGADTFVGKLMSFFNFANSALNVGSQIFSFVKTVIGIAGMPSGSGGSLSLDTNRMINQSVSMNASPVNIYMSSNVNQKYFKAQIENYNAMKQYTRI